MAEPICISLPDDVYDALLKLSKDSQTRVDQLVTLAIINYLESRGLLSDDQLPPEEEEKIKERLRALGYID